MTAPISVAQARAIDADAVGRLRMPSILLMENAARAVADAARSLGDRYCVYCGPGNNGGDGLAAARHLGRDTSVFLLTEPDPDRAPDAYVQYDILRRAGYGLVVGAMPALSTDSGLVLIDALFGTGLTRPLQGMALAFVHRFNDSKGRKLSVDIPSGLHGDTGEVLGAACRADVTVTFEAPKLGLVNERARPHVGEIRIARLGLP